VGGKTPQEGTREKLHGCQDLVVASKPGNGEYGDHLCGGAAENNPKKRRQRKPRHSATLAE